jgi:hypothetical protein
MGCDVMAAEIRKRTFRRNTHNVEEGPVGKLNSDGKLEMRTLSYVLCPLICFAILGKEQGEKYFPAFPAKLSSGGGIFVLEEASQAIRTILNAQSQMESSLLRHILLDPRAQSTLYFSQQLQDTVIVTMQCEFPQHWKPLMGWIQE